MSAESQKSQFFICHASEDKEEFVRPFARYLLKCGASIFHDEYSIKLGDSISAKINSGLKEAEVAIIILSHAFFQKNWPEAELQALINRQIAGKAKLVVVYHEVSHEEVAEQYPLLADLYAASSNLGIEKLASQIFTDTSFASPLKYIKSSFDSSENDLIEKGFSVSIRFIIGHLYDSIIDKYIFDMGNPETLSNRLSIYIKNNRYIVAQISDENGVALSLHCSVDLFRHKAQLFSFIINPLDASISIHVGGVLQSEIRDIPEQIFMAMKPGGACVTFNSLELLHPCPATISFEAIGGAINPLSLSKRVENYCDAIGKVIDE